MKFEINRPAKHGKIISLPEIRAILHSCAVILEYHGFSIVDPAKPIKVLFINREFDKTKTGSKSVATANRTSQRIKLKNSYHDSYHKIFSTLIHEMIHIYIDFQDNECEKLTSTLTSKIKEDIQKLANILVEGTQKRAAFIAHTKLSYKPSSSDFYDRNENHHKYPDSKGKKYRR